MYKFKLVLLAIFLIIGYAFALAQGEATETTDRQAAINAWAEREARAAEQAAEARGGGMHARSACVAPKKSTSAPAPSSASSAQKDTPAPAPTQMATPTPTQKATPAPQAPTQRPTIPPPSAPTSRPTLPTQKATPAPTIRPSGSVCDIVPTTQEPLKVLVPLYVYPGEAWDQVISGSKKVGTIAIVNPNSGPDPKGANDKYTTYMQKMTDARVEMVGYVYTSYGSRSIAEVKADIDIYATKYPGITGIFFDEASSGAADLPFYREAYNHVISKGWKHSILNPGVVPAQGYLDISSNIVIFESYGNEVNKKNYASWVKCAPDASKKAGWKYKFSGIAHTASASEQAGIISSMANIGMGLVYVTDGPGGCCTYNELTTYMSAQASSVAALNV